jgi:pimeloyl-ACP methyl ester carboxylesterase
MSFEPPPDPRTARRTTIGRWVSFILAVLLVALVAYLGFVGFQGSAQVAEPPAPSRDCRTPAIAFDWVYEAINYDAASDTALADLPDPANCPAPGELAGPRLQTSDGIALAGWYIPAGKGIGPTGPTVVLAHGHGSNKSNMLAYADMLHDDYNLVLFDFRNHGQSGDAQTTVGALEQFDLRAVIDWVVNKKEPEQLAVLGTSMGGGTALAEAATDARVDALVLDSTHATLANALQARLDSKGYPLSLPGSWSILLGLLLRTGQDISAVDAMQTIAAYDRPLLIIVGGQDDQIGEDDGQALLEAAENGGSTAELEVCADAGHGGPVSTCASDYRDWVLGFLARSLEP